VNVVPANRLRDTICSNPANDVICEGDAVFRFRFRASKDAEDPHGVCGRPTTQELNDGGHEARRLQPRRPAAVRCGALDHVVT